MGKLIISFNEKEIITLGQEIKDLMRTRLFPEINSFIKYLLPYFYPIQEKYKNFLAVLEKAGIADMEEYVTIVFDIAHTADKFDGEGLVRKLVKDLGRQHIQMDETISLPQFMKKLVKGISYEDMIPYMKGMYIAAEKNIEKEQEIAKKINILPEEERNLYEYFCLLTTKVWIRYVLKETEFPDPVLKIFLKDMAPDYYRRMNAFYEEEIVPQKLIEYIDSIEIPEEIIMLESEEKSNEAFADNSVLPTFQRTKEVFGALKVHFDTLYHEQLLKILETGNCPTKLIYKGNGNQLADAFRTLYEAQLITGCNKEELIAWVKTHFEYKSHRTGDGIPFNEKYLHTLISSDQSPCKNPIIAVKKDGNGNLTILTPDRKSRKKV